MNIQIPDYQMSEARETEPETKVSLSGDKSRVNSDEAPESGLVPL